MAQEIKVQTSKQFQLNIRDFFNGAIMAIGAPVLTVLYDAINDGGFRTINWEMIAKVAASSFIIYLLKNFVEKTKTVIVTNPQDAQLTVENLKKIKEETNTQKTE